MAANFLFYRKQCHIVSFERGLHPIGNPDVIGVTKDKDLIEVEIKISFSDFKANFEKLSIKRYENMPIWRPHYFYFLVHPDISEKCLNHLQAIKTDIKYGLITISKDDFRYTIKTLKNPIRNKLREKLSKEDIWRLVQYQSRTLADIMIFSPIEEIFDNGEGI